MCDRVALTMPLLVGTDTPEPFVTPWNFTVGDLNTALGTELDKITKGEVALGGSSLQVAARQLQTILDKPPPQLK